MTQRVTKTAFNGGRITPSMWWSPDVPIYARACKSILNWLPEVNGAITRRYGAHKLFELDPAYDLSQQGTAVKRIQFQYGENSFNTIFIYTDTTQAWVGDSGDRVTRITIFNASGQIVKEFDYTESPWVTRDLSTLFTLQSFDALYIYSSTAPTQRLTRFGEDNWALVSHVFNGGPWQSPNIDRKQIVSAETTEYNAGVSYSIGDIVFTGSSTLLTGASSNVFYDRVQRFDPERGRQFYDLYYTRITSSVSPTFITPGDKITITGAVPGTLDLNGEWKVARKDNTANWIDLVTGTEQELGRAIQNDYSGNVLTTAYMFLTGQRQTFHVSKVDANIGNDPLIQPSIYWTAAKYLNADITLTATADVWESTDVGQSFRITSDEVPRIYGLFSSSDKGEVSDPIPVQGQVTLTTDGGIWAGELALQLSIDQGGTWEDIAVITSVDGTRNGSVSRTISDFGGLVRAYMRERTAATGDTGCRFYVSVDDPQYNYFTISGYTSPTEVLASPQSPVSSLPSTWRWAKSAIGGTQGYPSAAAIIDNTMIISGIAGSPGDIWFSALGDWENWVAGGYTGAAFDIQIGKDTRNVVQWIQAKESLIIGTDAGEWTISPRDTESVISLLNYKLERQAEYGSSPVPAIVAGGAIIYVEVDSFRLRALERSVYDRGTFDPSDVSIQVPDWFETSNVAELAYARSPIPIVWVLMEDGSLYSWTFDPTNQVSAWAEHRIGGVDEVLSIGVTPTGGGDSLLVTAHAGGHVVELAVSFDNDLLDHTIYISGSATGEVFTHTGIDPSIVAYGSGTYLPADIIYTNTQGDAPSAKIIHLLSTPTDLTLRLDGELLVLDVDYYYLEGSNSFFLYMPYSGGTLEVLDSGVAADAVVYNSEQCVRIDFNTAYRGDLVYALSNWDLTTGTGPKDPATDYILFGATSALIPNVVPSELIWTPNIGSIDPLILNWDYTAANLYQTLYIPPEAAEIATFVVGYEQENLVWSTDLLGDFQLGGPGGVVKVREVDLLVRNSLGLQVRQYSGYEDEADEELWTEVPDATPTSLVGRRLPLYTGVQKVDFSSDTLYNGVDIQIRAQGPRKSTIGSMAVQVERVK